MPGAAPITPDTATTIRIVVAIKDNKELTIDTVFSLNISVLLSAPERNCNDGANG